MNVVYRFFSTLDSLGPTLLRLLLAIVFFVHSGQKIFGLFGGAGWTATLAQWTSADGLHIPYPLAVCGIMAELVGAVGLLFGFLTRLAALGIFCTMSVAIVTVHLAAGFLAPGGFEYPLTLAIVALSLVFSGGGRFSIDKAVTRQLLPPYNGPFM